MTLEAVIDAGACSAHGDCEEVAPEIFRPDDIAAVIGTGPGELRLAAARACPSSAIPIVERETGETVYP